VAVRLGEGVAEGVAVGTIVPQAASRIISHSKRMMQIGRINCLKGRCSNNVVGGNCTTRWMI
jgi:hypothetical protein